MLGICGGLQMLGEALIDPHGVDGNAPGLGLLPLVTLFAADKTVRHTHSRFHSKFSKPFFCCAPSLGASAGLPLGRAGRGASQWL